MLDTGTKYVTKDAFNDPILLINLMKITYAKDVLMIPKIAIQSQEVALIDKFASAKLIKKGESNIAPTMSEPIPIKELFILAGVFAK